MQFRGLPHQLQGGTEGPFRRLPGIGHRPQPSQIEMGVSDPMQTTNRSGLESEVLSHQLHGFLGFWMARQPALRHGINICAGQAESLWKQASLGIPIGKPRLTR